MPEWLEHLDVILARYPHVVATLEAVSTFAAVVVSLALASAARRANKTWLKAWVNIKFIVHSTIDPQNRPIYLTATITNTGMMPLRLPFSFFHWQLPRQKNASWMVNPMDYYGTDQWVPQQTYPIEIPPRATHECFISDIATFRQSFQEMARQHRGWSGRILLRFVRVTILTDDGTRCRAKISDNVQKEMRRINPLY
jgi:hypothetical protein